MRTGTHWRPKDSAPVPDLLFTRASLCDRPCSRPPGVTWALRLLEYRAPFSADYPPIRLPYLRRPMPLFCGAGELLVVGMLARRCPSRGGREGVAVRHPGPAAGR